MKYIAKPDTWFDAGTEVKLIDDYRPDYTISMSDSGLFEGIRNGKLDQEVCLFDEFEVIYENAN